MAPRHINTENVTKIVPMKAVTAPIIAFCTEFRCERLCDDGFLFLVGVGRERNTGIVKKIVPVKAVNFKGQLKAQLSSIFVQF